MLIAEMPELGQITGEQAAALTGLAPIAHDSGAMRGLCCTNQARDSRFESSMIAGRYEQLDPDEVQDHELVDLQ